MASPPIARFAHPSLAARAEPFARPLTPLPGTDPRLLRHAVASQSIPQLFWYTPYQESIRRSVAASADFASSLSARAIDEIDYSIALRIENREQFKRGTPYLPFPALTTLAGFHRINRDTGLVTEAYDSRDRPIAPPEPLLRLVEDIAFKGTELPALSIRSRLKYRQALIATLAVWQPAHPISFFLTCLLRQNDREIEAMASDRRVTRAQWAQMQQQQEEQEQEGVEQTMLYRSGRAGSGGILEAGFARSGLSGEQATAAAAAFIRSESIQQQEGEEGEGEGGGVSIAAAHIRGAHIQTLEGVDRRGLGIVSEQRSYAAAAAAASQREATGAHAQAVAAVDREQAAGAKQSSSSQHAEAGSELTRHLVEAEEARIAQIRNRRRIGLGIRGGHGLAAQRAAARRSRTRSPPRDRSQRERGLGDEESPDPTKRRLSNARQGARTPPPERGQQRPRDIIADMHRIIREASAPPANEAKEALVQAARTAIEFIQGGGDQVFAELQLFQAEQRLEQQAQDIRSGHISESDAEVAAALAEIIQILHPSARRAASTSQQQQQQGAAAAELGTPRAETQRPSTAPQTGGTQVSQPGAGQTQGATPPIKAIRGPLQPLQPPTSQQTAQGTQQQGAAARARTPTEEEEKAQYAREMHEQSQREFAANLERTKREEAAARIGASEFARSAGAGGRVEHDHPPTPTPQAAVAGGTAAAAAGTAGGGAASTAPMDIERQSATRRRPMLEQTGLATAVDRPPTPILSSKHLSEAEIVEIARLKLAREQQKFAEEQLAFNRSKVNWSKAVQQSEEQEAAAAAAKPAAAQSKQPPPVQVFGDVQLTQAQVDQQLAEYSRLQEQQRARRSTVHMPDPLALPVLPASHLLNQPIAFDNRSFAGNLGPAFGAAAAAPSITPLRPPFATAASAYAQPQFTASPLTQRGPANVTTLSAEEMIAQRRQQAEVMRQNVKLREQEQQLAYTTAMQQPSASASRQQQAAQQQGAQGQGALAGGGAVRGGGPPGDGPPDSPPSGDDRAAGDAFRSPSPRRGRRRGDNSDDEQSSKELMRALVNIAKGVSQVTKERSAHSSEHRREEMHKRYSASAASKTPRFAEGDDFATFSRQFTMFLSMFDNADRLLLEGPEYQRFPGTMDELRAQAGIPVGMAVPDAIQGIGALIPPLTAERERKAELEVLRMRFVWLALAYAVTDHPMCKAILSSVPAPNATVGYAQLVGFLQSAPEIRAQNKINALQSAMQGRNEPLTHYLARWQQLATDVVATGQPMSALIMRNYLLNSLRELLPSRRDFLNAQQAMSVTDIIHQLQLWESQDAAGRVLGRNSQTRSGAAAYSVSARSAAPSANLAQAGPSDECRYCHKKGHFARDCKKQKRDAGLKGGAVISNRAKSSKKGRRPPDNTRRVTIRSSAPSSSSSATGPRRTYPTTPGATCSYCGKQGHTEAQCMKKRQGASRSDGSASRSINTAASSRSHSRARSAISANSSQAEQAQVYVLQQDGKLASTQADVVVLVTEVILVPTAVTAATHDALTARSYHRSANQPSGQHEVLIDSGANEHVMTLSVGALENESVQRNTVIATAGKQRMHNPLRGDLTLTSNTGHAFKCVGALQHRDFSRNLLSTHRLIKDNPGCTITIDANSLRVFDRDQHLLLTAHERNGLYYADLTRIRSTGLARLPPRPHNRSYGRARSKQRAVDAALVVDRERHSPYAPQQMEAKLRITRCSYCARLGHSSSECARKRAASLRQEGKATRLTEAQQRLSQAFASRMRLAAPADSSSPNRPKLVPLADRLLAAHRRLGHISASKLQQLLELGDVFDIQARTKVPTFTCPDCTQGKMTRKSFGTVPEKHHAQRLFDRINADLQGPITPPSIGGARHWLLMRDEWSGFLWAFPLRDKSETAPTIQAWLQRIKREFGTVPKEFHSDRGTEFVNSTLRDLFAKEGIRHTTSLAYTPEHNARIERTNRTHSEMLRTIITAAGAPMQLWTLAGAYASSVMNRCMTHPARQRTPHQLMFDDPAVGDLDYFHPFGSDCWIRRPVQLPVQKYEPRALAAVFVGFDPDSIGWRYILPERPTEVFSSRDVKFDDNSFTHMAQLKEALHQRQYERGDQEEDEPIYSNEDALARAIRNSLRETPQPQPHSEPRPQPIHPQSASARPHSPELPELLEEDEDEEYIPPRASRPAAAPPSSSQPTRTSARSNRGVPGRDVYQPARQLHLASTSSYAGDLLELEAVLTQHFFPAQTVVVQPGESLLAAAIRVQRARIKHLDQTPAQRQHSIDQAERNFPLRPDRPKPNRRGAIVTPTQRCTGFVKGGKQCRMKTCNGRYCWRHLIQEVGVRISRSTVPRAGKGLFAARDFAEDETICKYTGDTSDTVDGFKNSRYILDETDEDAVSPRFVDAARTNTAPGRLINDPRNTDQTPNCQFELDAQDKITRVVATRPIRSGEELLLKYGSEYWQSNLKGVAQRKRKRKGTGQMHRKSKQKAYELSHCLVGPVASGPVVCHAASAPHLRDPLTVKEAFARADAPQWRAAMQQEQDSLRTRSVYTVVPSVPPGKRTIDTKWVFKLKRDASGKPVRYKARLVARGFMQREGVDYDQVYAPTVLYPSLRMLVALAGSQQLDIHAMDVETAYLYAPLEPEHEIYISTPPGFTGPETNNVLRLQRALYGLKQGAHQWNRTLDTLLAQLGFTATVFYDECVYTKVGDHGTIYLTVYVDDILIFNKREDHANVQLIKNALSDKFVIKDLGIAKEILGMRITRDGRNIYLDQAAYADTIIKEYGYDRARGEHVPARAGDIPARNIAADKHTEATHKQVTIDNYRSLVGSLAYLSNSTRPDIAHAVNMLQRDQAAPTEASLSRARQLLRFLRQHPDRALRYGSPSSDFDRDRWPATIYAFSDSDWAGDDRDARSTSGFMLFLAGGPIVWSCQKQSTVALSSTEAEYTAACEASRVIIATRSFLQQLNQPQLRATPLFIDNSASIRMASEGGGTVRRRHINIKHHWIREQVAAGNIELKWIATAEQLADIFTKPLPRITFERLTSIILHPLPYQ